MTEQVGAAVQAVVQILRSQEPEETLLAAIESGGLPGEVGLDLVENLGELIKVSNLENTLAIAAVITLFESGAISKETSNLLLNAIIEMAQDDGQTEVGDEPEEVVPASPIPTPTSESTAPASASAADRPIANLITSAVEPQQQFGSADKVPAEKLAEIRQAVGDPKSENFGSLRQALGSAILSQAELSPAQRFVDVTASLEILGILLGQRQAELTSAVFTVYELLFRKGFRLRNRDGLNRPLMTVSSLSLLWSRFRRWLDSHKSSLNTDRLVVAQKAITTLETFLVLAGHESVRKAIQRDLSTRTREQIILDQTRVLDAIAEELVAALPTTKEEAMSQLQGFLEAERAKLASSMRRSGTASLVEADTVLDEILTGFSSCGLWQEEVLLLETEENYNPTNQVPALSPADKRRAFFEIERKELDSIRAEIERRIEESQSSKSSLKKLGNLRSLLERKLEELDILITGVSKPVRPPMRRTEISGTAVPPPNTFTIPPPPQVVALKEAAHG